MGNAAAASGDTIYVNSSSGNDSWDGQSDVYTSGTKGPKLSIKNATGTVNAGGTVKIANGQYSGVDNTEITIDKNMNINGQSTKDTIINGTGTYWIFHINSGITLNILNLTLTNGTASYGGAISNYGSLATTNITFSGNSANGGGAIFNYGALTVSKCTFSGNTATGGGAIYNYGTLTASKSNFTGDIATDYGGGAIYNEGILTASNSTFSGNTASYGSAIYNYHSGTANVHFNRIIGNTASSDGSAIYNNNGTVDAALNWWGSNYDPSDYVYDTLVTPWLVLTLTVNPNFIVNNGYSNITADLLHDSNGVLHAPINGHVPDGIPVNFITTFGTIISPLNTVNGLVKSTLNCGSKKGKAYIVVTLDNQSLLTQVLLIDTIPPTASANPTSGLYNTIKNIKLSMSEQGTIYYTTDGSTPTYNSDRYFSHLTLTNTTILKFFAMDLSGNTSPIYTETYTIDTISPTAKANPIGGLYNTNKIITLSINENGTIYYTLNRTTPTTASTKYNTPITISTTTVLKYLAMDLAGNKSPIYTQNYTIDKISPKLVSTSPKNGATGFSKTVNIAIKFSENIKSSIYFNKITIKNLSTGKLVSITKSICGNTLNIKTSSARTANTWYIVTIPKAVIKDMAGNNLQANYTFKFKTGT